MSKTMDDILADQAKRNVLRPAPRLGKVECGYCGWTGKRKIGDLASCPRCGSPAGFQAVDEQRGKRG